ncbi:putative divergent NUDIX hydrolase [Tupanvirus deep ocean]|uniref:Divergent NUDIX hydrolase n=2 Tax=Tupanvirus TaxID=2094720 RepID=A0AC62A7P0_9VIRU|nr:putative divergent NUDIX hydrolase [Tupanvirus deep ocean]QKU33739.1 putative divergent NUDIX hydrolase [Tupanvirus deep ocean]
MTSDDTIDMPTIMAGYNEDICKKMSSMKLEESGSNNLSINYPIRLHSASDCKCIRIKNKLLNVKLKVDEQVVFILEKLWDDGEYKHCPPYVYITKKKDSNNDEANTALGILFGTSLEKRRIVMKYFHDFAWSPKKSIEVRKILRDLTSICFCLNKLTINEYTCNAGFVLFGSKDQLAYISHCFNKKVTKTEFSKVFLIKLSALHTIRDKMAYNLIVFSKSKEYEIMAENDNLYTLVGLQSELYLEKGEEATYNLPFGKREWCSDTIETSFECARRELYEEFNVQFSCALWDSSKAYSASLSIPYYIHRPGFMLYLMHINDTISINYHHASETIYLE